MGRIPCFVKAEQRSEVSAHWVLLGTVSSIGSCRICSVEE